MTKEEILFLLERLKKENKPVCLRIYCRGNIAIYAYDNYSLLNTYTYENGIFSFAIGDGIYVEAKPESFNEINVYGRFITISEE